MATTVNTQNPDRGTPEWWLKRLESRLVSRLQDMQMFDDYYHGKHRLSFHTARILRAFGTDFKDLRLNYCGVVVEALNERLAIDGFRFGKDDQAAAEAWAIWQRSGMDAGFPRGTRAGLVKGEFALIVWPDETDEPRIWVEDGSEVIVATDPANPHVRRAALKRWRDDDEGRLYATLYLPDGIYKYRSATSSKDTPQLGQLPPEFGKGGGAGPKVKLNAGATTWEIREVADEEWPLANPYNEVPVFALPNRPDLAGVGESELAAVLPIQDAINANLVNVLLAGQFSAFRQKWAANVRLETDKDTGKPKTPWQVSVDTLMTAPPPKPGDPEVRFGEFGQTDLSGYTTLHEALVQGLATIKRMPAHYFLGSSGAWPSGESLRSAEAGLTKMAGERGRDFGDPIEEAMSLAFRMKASQPGISSAARTRFLKWAAMSDAEALWRDPETKSESAHVDALVKLQTLGVPPEAIWGMIPASPQEIQQWKAMNAATPAPSPDAGGDPLTDPVPGS